MSYFRGPLYVWRSGPHVHLWSADGYDSWDESVWAQEYRQQNSETTEVDSAPSGVQIEQAQMDAYVVMRFAELVETGQLAQVIAHALQQARNVGSEALVARASAIAAAFPPIAAGAT